MLLEPNCRKRNCVHYLGIKGENETEQVPCCAAFPDGIPSEIAYGENKHTTPHAGDHGIQFEEEQTTKFADHWDDFK